MNELLTRSLKITLCSITLLARIKIQMPRPWHSISARPFLFVFHPRLQGILFTRLSAASQSARPTSKTYRISNRLKNRYFFLFHPESFPSKIFGAERDRRSARKLVTISFLFYSELVRPHDRSWVVQLVNCPRGFRHGTLETAINTDNPHETYTRLPTRGVIGKQKVGAQLCATWSIQSRPLWKR